MQKTSKTVRLYRVPPLEPDHHRDVRDICALVGVVVFLVVFWGLVIAGITLLVR